MNITQYTNNGYTFSHYEKGFYFFQKKTNTNNSIQAKFKEIDFFNGNFEFCTSNDITRM